MAGAKSASRCLMKAVSISTSSARPTQDPSKNGSRCPTPICGSRRRFTWGSFETTSRTRSLKRATRKKAYKKKRSRRKRRSRRPNPSRLTSRGSRIASSRYRCLQAGAAGQFYYVEHPATDGPPAGQERSTLHQYDLNRRKDDVFIPGVSDYLVSADKKKLLLRSNLAWSIVSVTPKPQAGTGRINVDDIEVRIDPRAEWTQMCNEAGRINGVYLYATNMRGVDWNAARQKSAQFLPHLATRNDLNLVIQW